MEEYLSLIKHCSSMKNLPFRSLIEVRIRFHSSYDCISQLIVVCPHYCMDQLKLNVRDNSFLRVIFWLMRIPTVRNVLLHKPTSRQTFAGEL